MTIYEHCTMAVDGNHKLTYGYVSNYSNKVVIKCAVCGHVFEEFTK